jgi:hypothetical protein
MTRTIEHSRKHGPFDPRWLTFRAVRGFEQLERARPAARRAAVQAWEGEGGALLPEERPISRNTGERRSADAVEAGGAAALPRLAFTTTLSRRPRS